MGLQHALAMVGGLITPPLVVSSVANDPGVTQFLISSALIVSGVCTIVHVIQLKIPFVPLYYGTGRSWCSCGFGFSYVICRALVLASVRGPKLMLGACLSSVLSPHMCTLARIQSASLAAGVISVIGISFTFLPLAQTSIGYMMVRV